MVSLSFLGLAWRQGQSYTEDLRARVLAAIDGGLATASGGLGFRVSGSYIYKALIRRRRTGEVSASTRRGHRPRKLDGRAMLVWTILGRRLLVFSGRMPHAIPLPHFLDN